ncbi:tRNA (guanosine(46)-N7)-methyltransferase TrmB [Oceanicella sp. SM1341]|uniref:tRNA (guanosine(46)-N7)-methyltransferase TrmB n=1 Tax=Oceanicella sp. SM1341 TaxID=1548889 RepID=UPI000E4C6FF1|nr:tRNA (guanosine(46)-N7)-methyltransferase TrmB [Oceanicella sp. SM1341]
MTEPTREDGAPWRNFYGRRHGKTLRSGQKQHMQTTLQEIAPRGVTWAENPARAAIDPGALFADGRPLWLEIGFGGGEHMLAQAAANRDVGIIGCEPYVNGVAMFLSQMAREEIDNIRVHAGDARDLLDVLPEASIDRAFLLYPDPWPKKRHHRRRFVNPEFVDPLARALKPGAIFRVATDIPDYVRHTLEHMCARPDFEWLAERPADWREPWADWHRTRYEAKAIREERTPHYLTFRRL